MVVRSAEILMEQAGEVLGEVTYIRKPSPTAIDAVWWAITKHTHVIFDGQTLLGMIARMVGTTADGANDSTFGKAAAFSGVTEAVTPVTLVS